MLLVVDSRTMFLNFFVGVPGRCYDVNVQKGCPLFRRMKEGSWVPRVPENINKVSMPNDLPSPILKNKRFNFMYPQLLVNGECLQTVEC